MFNFTLINFYNAFAINQLFFNQIYSNKDKLKEQNISFNQISGSFPFNYWNGGINSNIIGNICQYSDIENVFKQQSKSLRLNCSNILLNEKDFYNNYNKVILEQGQNGSTVIEIANLKLYKFIKENYPNYNKFILSPNAWLNHKLTPDEVNIIAENDDFELISLPPNLNNDIEYLKALKYKNKIEITINPRCPSYCPQYEQCHLQEHNMQYNFSQNSILGNCIKCNSYDIDDSLKLEDLKSIYIPLGINHFRLEECLPNELLRYYIFLVKFFIKEEYQEQIIEEGLLELTEPLISSFNI